MQVAKLTLMLALIAGPAAASTAKSDGEVEGVVTRHVSTILPADQAGGVAVALRIDGRTLFFNYGYADRAAKRPITSDSLFPLASVRKVFEAILLAQAVWQGQLALDDPVAKHVTELQQGGDIRRVTLGQLATHTSGLQLPQDVEPWPDWGYTRPQFIRAVAAWKADGTFQRGRQHRYTHAGFVLLYLALERRLGAPIDALFAEHILRPLGMTSTALPRGDDSSTGVLSPAHRRRAVQGYTREGEPHGKPGDHDGYYQFAGGGKLYSSARDLAVLLAAHLGEVPVRPALREGMELAQQGVLAIAPDTRQALAWEVSDDDKPAIVGKHGGLYNASAFIGFMPGRKLGIAILSNRGEQRPDGTGRAIMLELIGLKD